LFLKLLNPAFCPLELVMSPERQGLQRDVGRRRQVTVRFGGGTRGQTLGFYGIEKALAAIRRHRQGASNFSVSNPRVREKPVVNVLFGLTDTQNCKHPLIGAVR